MVVSDPVALGVPVLADLAVDLYLTGDSGTDAARATYHAAGLTTSYLSPTGDHTGAAEFPVEQTFQSWFYLSRVEVMAPEGTPGVVTLGDSITDGTASTPDTNSRWPDFLARRLVARLGNTPPGVMNVGIAGNRVLSDNAGLAMFRRNADVPPLPPAESQRPVRAERAVTVRPRGAAATYNRRASSAAEEQAAVARQPGSRSYRGQGTPWFRVVTGPIPM